MFEKNNYNKKTKINIEILEDRTVPSGTPILFDFEGQPTSANDTPLTLTSNGLNLEISRSGSVFGILNTDEITDGRFPASMGKRVLTPPFSRGDKTPFLFTFSKAVSSVSVEMGDFGDDNPDTLKVDLYSQPGGKGTLVGSKSVLLPHKGATVFTSATVTATATSALSAVIIGGTSDFPNSTFVDNLKIIPVETGPALGSIAGRVSLDQNGGKSIGPSDPGVSSITVYLDSNNNGVRDGNETSTQTGNDGSFFLSDVSPGNIILRTADPEGRKILLPAAGRHEFKLAPGETRTGANLSLKGETILKILGTTPAPGSTETRGVSGIQVQFNSDVDPGARWGDLFSLVGAGANGKRGDADDLIYPLTFQSWNASSKTMELKVASGWLPKDLYTFTALENLANVEGNSLDGEYQGRFPTGDGKGGGSFSYQFTVTNTPPLGKDFRVSALQNQSKIIRPILEDNEGDLKSIEIVKQPSQGSLVPTSNFGEFLYTPKPGFSGMDGFRVRGVDPAGPGPDFAGTIAVAAAPVDFRPTSLVIADPGSIAVGKEATFTWTVANSGLGTTLPTRWVDEVYLSHDAQWDPDDFKIASFSVNIPGIGNGASYKSTQKAVIPFGEWAGEAYLLLRVNTDQGQLETQISNNEIATPVKLQPAVSLLTPDHSFLGRENPFTVKWRDAVPTSGGQLTLALDTDNLPANGKGAVELKRGLSAGGDGSLDKSAITIPPSIKDGKYFLWASLESPGAKVYSQPVPVQVFQSAFVGEDERGDATGGGSYEVFGVDLGISQGVVNFRVRTNYSPTSNGGEIYFNVGGKRSSGTGKTVAIGVRNRTNETGQSIQAGSIYQGAKFQGGTVHKDVPIFAQSYTSQGATKANISVSSTPDRGWNYEINGSTTLESLGAKAGESLEVGWGMYCGNDFSSTDNGQPQTPEENDRKNLLGAGFVIKPTEDTGDATPSFRWGSTVKVDFSVVNQGNAPVDATRVRFVLSPDSTVTKDDLSVQVSSGSVIVSALPVGQSFNGSVEVKLPETPPKGMDKGGTVVLGMICDSSESVAESDENDNLNFGMGLDKAQLRVGRAKVINVLIHGYTPPIMSQMEMENEYRKFRDGLISFSDSQPKLKNQVEGYVTEWVSDTGFSPALIDVATWHLVEIIKNGGYKPDIPGGDDTLIARVKKYLIDFFLDKSMEGFQAMLLSDAQDCMNTARGLALDAAKRTVDELLDPNYSNPNDLRYSNPKGISLLGPPEEGQWIHVIGHSRGGAVGAEVVRRLSALGYKVGRYTALDGFSVDWPDGDKIQDLDILGSVRQGSASKMINYRVEEALITEQIDNFIKDKFNEYLSGLLGKVTDVSLTQNVFVDENGSPLLWKAPSRAPLFDDVMMDAQERWKLPRSNHVNITQYFFTFGPGYALENPYQAMIDGVSGVRSLSAHQSLPPIAATTAFTTSTIDTFNDGSFEKAGQIQRLKSTMKTLGETGDKTVDALFQRVQKASYGLEDGLYMEGQGNLVQSKTNTVLQITRSGTAKFQEVVQLSPNARYLGFKVSSLVANSGDELRVVCKGKTVGRVGLKVLAGKGFYTQWFDVSEYAGQMVSFEFEVRGNPTLPCKIQLDDLQILPAEPGGLRNRPRFGVIEDVTQKLGTPMPLVLPLKIADVDTPLEKLTINAVSDNSSLLPNTGIKIVRNNGTVSLVLSPVQNAIGSAGITIAVQDGASGPDKAPFVARMHFQLTLQPQDRIPAPGNLKGIPRPGGVKLSWSSPSNFSEKEITDYRIEYRKADQQNWTPFADGISPATHAEWKGTLNGGTYFFRVSAQNSQNTGLWSPALEVLIPPAPPVDLDGNGQADLLVVNTSGVPSGVLLDQAGKVTGSRSFGNVSPWQLAASGDFDGNGVTDLVWRNPITFANEIWLMEADGSQKSRAPLPLVKDERIEATGDFDGDNKEDIIWRNLTNGQNRISLMNGSVISGTAYLGGGPEKRLVALSPRYDFNGDGKSDLIWKDTSGSFRLWTMDGSQTLEQYPLPLLTGKEIVAGDDFDGDGLGDLVGWNSQTRQYSVHFFAHAINEESTSISLGSGTLIVGSTDLNQDGRADLLWQNTEGKTVAGFFQGRRLDRNLTLPLPTGMKVAPRPGRFVGGVEIDPPGSPREIKVTPGNGQVNLSWLPPQTNGGSSINDYIIQYKPRNAANWTTVADGINVATSATIKGLTNGLEYTFTVTAVNAAGKGPASAPTAFVKPEALGVPGQPTGLTTTPGNGQVILSWIAPVSNGGSAIVDYLTQFRKSEETGWTDFQDGPSTTPGAIITGLTNGARYVFRVLAKNSIGAGPGSTPTGEVIPGTVPGQPTGLQAMAGNGSVALTWVVPGNNGGYNITDYLIQYRDNGASSWTTYSDGVSTQTSVTVNGLINGNSYSFQVSARNAMGTGSASPVVNAMPGSVPGAPSGLQAVAGNRSVTLQWNPPGNQGGYPITDYTIQYQENGVGAWLTYPDGVSTATAITMTGLVNGNSYRFLVLASNGMGLGDASAPTAPVMPETWTTLSRVGDIPSGKRGKKTTFTVQLLDSLGSPVINQPVSFFEFWNYNLSKNPPTYSKMVELNGKKPVYTDANGLAVLSYTIPVDVNADNVRLLAKFPGAPGFVESIYEIVKIPIGPG